MFALKPLRRVTTFDLYTRYSVHLYRFSLSPHWITVVFYRYYFYSNDKIESNQ